MNYDKAPVIFQVVGQYVVIRYMLQRFIILSYTYWTDRW